MSALLPDVLAAYSDQESADLKLAVTALPVAFSAIAPPAGMFASGDVQPQAPTTEVRESGEWMRTSFDDWYYRIHVLPAALALGNVAGGVQRTVVVWNAHFSARVLEDFQLAGDPGLSYSSAVEPPASLPPLEDVSYLISISAEGPPVISGTATWTIDGVDYTVPITGQRSVLFGFRPDWRLSRVVETYEWLNTLTTTYSGYEQVMSVRQEPRRALDYRLRLRDQEAQLFDQSLFGWTGRVFGLPWWPEGARMTADAFEGATAVYLDTSGRSFSPQTPAVIHRSAHEFEMLDVAEVHADRLVLRNTLAGDWPRGTRVYPVLPSIPPQSVATGRALPGLLDAAVRFVASPTDAPVNLPTEAAAQTYRGYELYTGETNWRSALGIEITSRRKDVDGETGPYTVRPKAKFPLVVRGFSWLLKNREEAQSLLAFFARRAGRRVPVWMPSGTDDFKLVAPIESGQSALRVRRTEAGRLIGLHEARRDIVILVRGGQRLTRRIVGIEDAEDNTSTVLVDSAFSAPIALTDVKRVSYLGLYRLASDTVTIAWATPSVAEVEVNFVLKKEPSA